MTLRTLSTSGPERGEWYVVPQRAITVSKNYGGDVEHRWMVASEPYGGQVALVLRTTTPTYSDHEHDEHPDGHEATCQLNKPGFLCKRGYHDTYLLFSGSWSCDEPDRALVDELREPAVPPPRPKKRGRR